MIQHIGLAIGLYFVSHLVVASNQEQPGEKLYLATCQSCHAPKKAPMIKAPVAFNVKAWQSRLMIANQALKDNPKKFPTVDDYFLYQVKIGKGLMHHGGLCKEYQSSHPSIDCSDKAYKEAIKYMMTEKKQ